MATYSLVWNGQLQTITVPVTELTQERSRWTFAQVRTTGGGHEQAMRAALSVEYPGLSWTRELTAPPLPFSVAVSGHDSAVPLFEHDMSSRVLPLSNHSQMRTPPASLRKHPYEGSGSADSRKPPPLFSTSRPSSPRDPPRVAAGPRGPSHGTKRDATPRMAGWMGSAPTKLTGTPGVPCA